MIIFHLCSLIKLFLQQLLQSTMEMINKEGFKYNIEELVSTSDEFIIVKEFYDTTLEITDGKHENHSDGKIRSDDQLIYQIYKVNENNPTTTGIKKSNNIMLFHGTSENSATRILKDGFKNSE